MGKMHDDGAISVGVAIGVASNRCEALVRGMCRVLTHLSIYTYVYLHTIDGDGESVAHRNERKK